MLNGLQNVLKDFNSTLILKRAKQILNGSADYQTKEIIYSTNGLFFTISDESE